jgi:hypothetical protein
MDDPSPTHGRRAGLETSSSSTVGDGDHTNTDVEAMHAAKSTVEGNAPIMGEKDDEMARTDEVGEMAKRNALEGDFPEGGFRAWAGVASTGFCLVSSVAIASKIDFAGHLG